ncbi:MAG: PAS domain S-box protein [Agriterribacter sp.]
MQKKLSLSYEDIVDFVENASVPLHWLDENGIVIWANQKELEYLGYNEDEYIGKSIRKFHADEVTANDMLRRLHNNETLHNYRASLLAKNGVIKHVLIDSNVLRREGKFIHTRCFTRDYSDFTQEEERRSKLFVTLAESEARLRMAIEATKIGSWDYDPASGKLEWSDECIKIYGLSTGTPISFELYSDLIHPEDREYVLSKIKGAMNNPFSGAFDIKHRIHRMDDNMLRWVRGRARYILMFLISLFVLSELQLILLI